MSEIESTPEMATRIYAVMARNLDAARRRLGRPLTLADKALLGHLDDPETPDTEPGKSYVLLRPDRVVLQDVLGQTAMLQFMQSGRTGWRCRPRCTATTSSRRGPTAKPTCAPRSPRTAKCTTSCARRPPSTAPASGPPAPESSIRWCSRTTPSPARSSWEPIRTRPTPAAWAPAPSVSAAPTRSRRWPDFPGKRSIRSGSPWCSPASSAAGRHPRTSFSGWPASSPFRAPPTPSSSTSARGRARSAPPARPRSPTWAPSSAPPHPCFPPTNT